MTATLTRPDIARAHDHAWSGPEGHARRELYRYEEPDTRCRRCCADVDTIIHHLHYRHPTGTEPRRILIWLCPHCHRIIHFRHDYRTRRTHIPTRQLRPPFRRWSSTKKQAWRAKHRRHDPWPYQHLPAATIHSIRLHAPWRWLTWGPDRTHWTPPPHEDR